MRVKLKPAAASAAAAFLLLLLFDLTWPRHGIWLLVVGLTIGLVAAYLWWRDRYVTDSASPAIGQGTPFSDVGAYGLSGTALQSAQSSTSGVSLAAVLAPVAALSILLFIGGALGSAEAPLVETSTSLEANVEVLDRSRDGEPAAPQADPPRPGEIQRTQSTTVAATVAPAQTSTTSPQAATEEQQSTAPVKPIVVAAPQAASPSGNDSDNLELVPESANTFEYTVEDGDTLYDIAERYDSTVETLMQLNKLNPSSFIHPGDVLLIPLPGEPAEAEES